MAASIPSGKHAQQGGFTYLGVLFLIVVMGMGLASAGELWSTASRRDREKQLLWVGTQYAQALRSYYRSSPGLAQYPKELADLLDDQRFPEARHHLRQLYPDPIGQGEWALQRGFDGRITGLNSPSTEVPMKQSGFPRSGRISKACSVIRTGSSSLKKPSSTAPVARPRDSRTCRRRCSHDSSMVVRAGPHRGGVLRPG